jgi:Glucose-regulated metallo-peptidase M90
MLSRIIAAPFILLTFIFGYLGMEVDIDWVVYAVPCVVALAVIYVLSPQIDFWWAKKHPPEMPPKLRMFMEKQHPFYSTLSASEQQRFRERVMLYLMANEFMPQKMEEVPKDIQTLVASNVVQLTFGQNDFLLDAFEHVIVYPRPFPSPQYPTNFHTSEIYPPDKVMIFAMEQLIPGTINPTKHYNIGLHEYIRAYLHMYPNNAFPELPESNWLQLEQISGWSKEHIFKYINRPDVHILPVSISHFFVFGKKFKTVLPELYELYKNTFNMDTAREGDPVVVNERISE